MLPITAIKNTEGEVSPVVGVGEDQELGTGSVQFEML
jgi:hypothetical protein